MMSPVVTIVVPVYDVGEEAIKQCLRSISAQTFESFEVVVVDDGSPGGEWTLINSFAEADPRIRPFQKPNGGLADARNFGVRKAEGQWVTFVDSDDTIPPYALEVLTDGAIDRNADIVIGTYRYHRLGGGIDVQGTMPLRSGSVFEGYRFLLEHAAMVTVAKLYRRELLDRLPQPTGFWFEDVAWTPTVMTHADRVVYLHDVVYDYRPRETSITQRIDDPRILDGLQAIHIALDLANPEHRDAVAVWALRRLLFEARTRPSYADRYLGEIATLAPILKSNRFLARDHALQSAAAPYLAPRAWIPKTIAWVRPRGTDTEVPVSTWRSTLAHADATFVEIPTRHGDASARELDGLRWLYSSGGILLRTTLEANGPIAPLLGDGAFVVRDEHGDIAGDVVAATAGHPFVAATIGMLETLLADPDLVLDGDLLGRALTTSLGTNGTGVVVHPPSKLLHAVDDSNVLAQVCSESSYDVPATVHTSGRDDQLTRRRPGVLARARGRVGRSNSRSAAALRQEYERWRRLRSSIEFKRRTRPAPRRRRRPS